MNLQAILITLGLGIPIMIGIGWLRLRSSNSKRRPMPVLLVTEDMGLVERNLPVKEVGYCVDEESQQAWIISEKCLISVCGTHKRRLILTERSALPAAITEESAANRKKYETLNEEGLPIEVCRIAVERFKSTTAGYINRQDKVKTQEYLGIAVLGMVALFAIAIVLMLVMSRMG